MAVPANADVLVIGGGPAGSSAAALLARRGYDIVLVDKVRHPRETVGESVLPSAWKYFDLLGVTRAVDLEGLRAESFITDDAGNSEVALSTGNGDRAQRVRCRFLIDATGQASFTARQFGTK